MKTITAFYSGNVIKSVLW